MAGIRQYSTSIRYQKKTNQAVEHDGFLSVQWTRLDVEKQILGRERQNGDQQKDGWHGQLGDGETHVTCLVGPKSTVEVGAVMVCQNRGGSSIEVGA
jgi:hypothetical protein